MSRPVILLGGADADLQGIFNRLEDYGEGFGVEFITAVDAYLIRLSIFRKAPRPTSRQSDATSCAAFHTASFMNRFLHTSS